MYLGYTEWVNAGYIVHFLAMYLRCTSSVHHPLPPVGPSQQGSGGGGAGAGRAAGAAGGKHSRYDVVFISAIYHLPNNHCFVRQVTVMTLQTHLELLPL